MIRPATSDDVAALVELNHEVQALHRAAMPERYTDPDREAIEAYVRGLVAAPDLVVLVAEDAGRVVGYAVVKRVASPAHVYAHARLTAHVDQLGVAARARRGGHGRALMAAAEAQARAWGAASVTLDVQTFNADAIAFYEALGYAIATSRMTKRC